jgi:hypothetical protein
MAVTRWQISMVSFLKTTIAPRVREVGGLSSSLSPSWIVGVMLDDTIRGTTMLFRRGR